MTSHDSTMRDDAAPLLSLPKGARAQKLLALLDVSTMGALRRLSRTDLEGRRGYAHDTISAIVDWAANIGVVIPSRRLPAGNASSDVASPAAPRASSLLASVDSSVGVRLEIESALHALVGADVAHRALVLVAFDADNAPTQGEAGKMLGVPGLAIHRAKDAVTKKQHEHRLSLPRLHEVLALLERVSPCTRAEAASALVATGLGDERLSIAAVLRAAELLGFETPLRIEYVSGVAFVAAKAGQLDTLWSLMRAQAKDGFATVRGVADAAAQSSPAFAALATSTDAGGPGPMRDELTEDADARENRLEALVRAVVNANPDAVWIPEQPQAFFLRRLPRNKIEVRIDRVLAVAGRIAMPELRAAMRRDHSLSHVPSVDVLAAVCRELPDVEVIDNVVIDRRPRRIEDSLNPGEQDLVKALRARGPVLSGGELSKSFEALGQRGSNASVYLRRTVVIRRVDGGGYALIGPDPLPVEDVRAAAAARDEQNVVLRSSVGPGGCCEMTIRISRGLRRNGVVGLPVQLAPSLGEREFEVRYGSANAPITGRLRSDGRRLWRFLGMFARHGGEPGDLLRLVLDPAAGRVVVSRLEHIDDQEVGGGAINDEDEMDGGGDAR